MAKAKPAHTIYDGMEFEDYEFREFPKMIFKPKLNSRGETVHKVVEDAKQLEEYKKVGWVLTPPSVPLPAVTDD